MIQLHKLHNESELNAVVELIKVGYFIQLVKYSNKEHSSTATAQIVKLDKMHN